MADNNRIRENSERKGVLTGVVMTAVLHLCALALVSFTGLKYIYPPPQERAMLIDFTDEPAALVEEQYGTEPQAEEVNLDEAVRLVQQSSSPEVADRENLTPETAACPGMARKDTTLTAAHAAADSSALFKAGQAAGNTASGRTDGKPNAHVQGRSTVGNIPRPVYNVQESGIVVVNIVVDNYGNVVRAVPGGDGTTVLDKTLYAAARNAAMDTHFNMSADAPAMQEGTITYYFNLK